ncbi:MAG: hypothetical protein WDN29_03475 [Methylovirgula sp.]
MPITPPGASGPRGSSTTRKPRILNRPVWHLPSEKTYGFADLFARLAAGATFSGDPAQIRIRLANLMGVGRKSARKFLGHFVRAARRRLRR